MTNVICVFANAQRKIWVTFRVAVNEGKQTEEGTMTSTPERLSHFVAAADPPEAQTLTPVTTEEASDILTNCKI
jgi:hypothetical protein